LQFKGDILKLKNTKIDIQKLGDRILFGWFYPVLLNLYCDIFKILRVSKDFDMSFFIRTYESIWISGMNLDILFSVGIPMFDCCSLIDLNRLELPWE
jgi:hypothetical protein